MRKENIVASYTRLGDLLTSIGLITDDQLHQALEMQKGSGKRLGQVLIDSGMITEMQLIEALQVQLGVDFIDLSATDISAEMASILPKTIAKRYQMVPVKVVGDDLFVAMSDPLNFIAIEEAKAASRRHIVPMIATMDSVKRSISMLYGNERAKRAIEDMRKENAEGGQGTVSFGPSVSQIAEDDLQSAPAIRLVNSIIERAINEKASDVHMEPHGEEMTIRMRVDGILHTALTVPKELQAAVTSRVKIMCGMDVTERRIPQDGRTSVRIKMKEVDIRASTLPTVHGEKIVLRILDKSLQLLTPEGIGLSGDDLAKFDGLMQSNQGVILVVGPTGSGKSSTMATMVNALNTEEINLVTLEDPVEYEMEGVNQVQINEKVGMTFAGGLRSILRQDPDIISVGEIRDGETAEIAMRAAITGHLVLSTIHTNDAPSTIDRLIDIGIEPYMISTAVRAIISQRLVRKICPHCREAYTPTEEELALLGLDDAALRDTTFYRGRGCPECYGSGYRGRTGVFEILLFNKDIRHAVHTRASHDALARAIEGSGFVPIAGACRKLVLDGVTSAEEAFRIVNIED